MATTWYRSTEKEQWQTIQAWRSLTSQKAHQIADCYNRKYDAMYWVTEDGGQPSKDMTP